MNILDIAKICHQVNKYYCESIGDKSQVHWDFAEDWQKESAVKGVKLHLNNVNAGAKASHDSWATEKVNAGWVFGENKDPVLKTHPCLVDFKGLPVNQQSKDFIFMAIVHEMRDFIDD